MEQDFCFYEFNGYSYILCISSATWRVSTPSYGAKSRGYDSLSEYKDRNRDFVPLCINDILFNRIEVTDFQSVCQEKGGVNSGGTSFLLKVGLLFSNRTDRLLKRKEKFQNW